MAVDYLARHHLTTRPCRFDVVAIDDGKVTVYPSAFESECT
jgi:Holliday junction resolvase-like predicted endonuclease